MIITRFKWTKELIRQKLIEMIDALQLDYFPTRQEIAQYYGDERLTNKISKTLGFYGWAKELGMPIKSNDTSVGKQAERLASELLISKGYTVEQMAQNHPYDLLVNNSIKVDVKFSHLSRHPNGYGYFSFRLAKKHPTCDFYMLMSENEQGKTSVYIVPSLAVMQKQISMGEHESAYHRYIDRFDYLDQYDQFYTKVGVT